jgi:ribonuclease Z
MFELTILGCHSATPTENKHTSSQILEVNGNLFLIDCGEGTQMQLRKAKVRFTRIKHIFISHLHGDHYFGLIGLISTFNLLNRDTNLHIYGPKGLKEIITLQIKLANSWTNYKLIFHELHSSSSDLIFEDEKISVHTIPLDHRIYTNGFIFKEKPFNRKLDINKVEDLNIDKAYYRKLKQGEDVINEKGEIIRNELVTLLGRSTKSYAFCSDTAYCESIIPIIFGVDVLYHESTFLEEHANLCFKTKHSTAKQAATIALKANAKQLILGHYSTRYGSINGFKSEASIIFKDVLLSDDGKVFDF